MKWCIICALRTGFSQFYKTGLKEYTEINTFLLLERWKLQYQHSNPTTDSWQLLVHFHLWTLEVPLTENINFTNISQLKLVEKIITIQTCGEWGGIKILMCLLSRAVSMNNRQVHLVPRWKMHGATPAVPPYTFVAWCLIKHPDNLHLWEAKSE
jgi:hypothetical protein